MPLKSMTGFARVDGAEGGTSWAWEVRSVNGRGLDIRTRTPPGMDFLEPKLREIVAKHLSRGSVSINLAVKRTEGAAVIRLNEAALTQVVAAAERVRTLTGAPPPTTEGLLALRGVLEYVEPVESEAATQSRNTAMLADFTRAIKALIAARGDEGARLESVFRSQLADIGRLVAIVQNSPARTPDAIRRRLQDMLARILDSGTKLDDSRLYQEAAIAATRVDVEEEVKRLTAHIAAAKELLAVKEPVGRKFDFLTQEFNREANTLCSKANDPEITRAGLELKAVIDQMREQVQNIE